MTSNMWVGLSRDIGLPNWEWKNSLTGTTIAFQPTTETATSVNLAGSGNCGAVVQSSFPEISPRNCGSITFLHCCQLNLI